MTRNERIRAEYLRLRKTGENGNIVGENAKICFQGAKINIAFADAESAGLVRLRWIPEHIWDIENLEGDCFNPDVNTDIHPDRLERERKEFHEKIERDGVWGLQGEFRILPLHHGAGDIVPYYSEDKEPGWESADAVWGFVGTETNGHETDIKSETLIALRDSLRSRCPCCRRSA